MSDSSLTIEEEARIGNVAEEIIAYLDDAPDLLMVMGRPRPDRDGSATAGQRLRQSPAPHPHPRHRRQLTRNWFAVWRDTDRSVRSG